MSRLSLHVENRQNYRQKDLFPDCSKFPGNDGFQNNNNNYGGENNNNNHGIFENPENKKPTDTDSIPYPDGGSNPSGGGSSKSFGARALEMLTDAVVLVAVVAILIFFLIVGVFVRKLHQVSLFFRYCGLQLLSPRV